MKDVVDGSETALILRGFQACCFFFGCRGVPVVGFGLTDTDGLLSLVGTCDSARLFDTGKRFELTKTSVLDGVSVMFLTVAS